MLLSLNWLEEFVKLPKDINSSDLANKLTLHTVEVEGYVDQKESFAGVVIGKILEVEQHPNADRLKLVKVDIKKEILSIVCGAPNVEVGQNVVVATIGTILPNDLEIKESEIRGVKSFGMLCAEDELGLGSYHEGIMVLDAKAKIGQNFSQHLKLNDIVLEIDNKSLSNRSDLWGHYGMAREISTFYNQPLTDYKKILVDDIAYGGEKLEVKIEDKKTCLRYMAVKIKNVKVEPSPTWLKERLLAIGLRPINNIVDITNFVMMEIGQPLHAFTADNINKIIVRKAKKDEFLETLDGKERELDESMLLISSETEVLAIAGVIGGQKSGVSEETKDIILESANFEATSIRKTSDKLSLRTESSMRFEKTLDPNFTELGLQRALGIIMDLCPEAEIVSELVDIKNFELNNNLIDINISWINEKIGQDLDDKEIISTLESLGFSIERDEDLLHVTTPSWRAVKDILIKEDILEEILRIHGYDNIISQSPSSALTPPIIIEGMFLENKIKDILSGQLALSETYNYSFNGENQLTKLNLDFSNYIKLVNPISDQYTLLRTSLLPGLLNNVKINQFNFNEVRLFEIGKIFLKTPGNEDKEGDYKDRLPYQENRLAFLLSGRKGNYFEEVKGLTESLLLTIFNNSWEVEFVLVEDFPSYSDPRRSVRIRVNGRDLGLISVIKKESLNNLGIKNEVVFAELNLVEIKSLYSVCPPLKYKALQKYPSVSRDLAFVVEAGMMYNDLRREMLSFHDLIESVVLFDSYQDSKIGNDKKNLAFHIIYNSSERTLTAEEVDQIQGQLITRLEEKFNAQIRNF